MKMMKNNRVMGGIFFAFSRKILKHNRQAVIFFELYCEYFNLRNILIVSKMLFIVHRNRGGC